MKLPLLIASAGALCSAASYVLTRNGIFVTLPLSPPIVLLMAATTGALVRVAEASTKPCLRLRRLQIVWSFSAGAAVGELIGFVRWYNSSGYQDYIYFDLIVIFVIVEWVMIGLLGGMVVAVAAVPESTARVWDDG